VKALIILEDPTHDQFIVKPIVEKLLEGVDGPFEADAIGEP
jgi:hypothetical protein